jgi:hypothetical protein
MALRLLTVHQDPDGIDVRRGDRGARRTSENLHNNDKAKIKPIAWSPPQSSTIH